MQDAGGWMRESSCWVRIPVLIGWKEGGLAIEVIGYMRGGEAGNMFDAEGRVWSCAALRAGGGGHDSVGLGSKSVLRGGG